MKASDFEEHIVKKEGASKIEFFEVDNTKSGVDDDSSGVSMIKDILDRMVNSYWEEAEEQPMTWVQFERLLMAVLDKTGSSILTTEEAYEVATRLCDIENNEEAEESLIFVSSVGSILYYPESEALRNVVFTSPRWVIRMFAAFVRPAMFYDESLPHPAVDEVLRSGFMSWELAKALFDKADTKENEYTPTLNLLHMFDIACPAQRGDTHRMQPGTNLFVPCLSKHHFNEATQFQQWSVDNHLPPPLILLPDGVDMIPESLFFRLEKRCIDEYCCSPDLTLHRNRCVLPLKKAYSPAEDVPLRFELLYLSGRFITATVFSKHGGGVRLPTSVVSQHCSRLLKFVWSNVNECKKKGMRGLVLELCTRATRDDNLAKRTNLVQLYPVRHPEEIRNKQGGLCSKSFQDAIKLWHEQPSTEIPVVRASSPFAEQFQKVIKSADDAGCVGGRIPAQQVSCLCLYVAFL